MALAWIAARMTDGLILDDVTTFEPDWPLRDTLSSYDTVTGRLYLRSAGAGGGQDDDDPAEPGEIVVDDWRSIVQAGGTVLACYDEDDSSQSIQWAGYVNTATPDTQTSSVELSLVTIAGYWTRRYVPDVTYLQGTGRNDVIASLIRWACTHDGLPGVSFTVVQVGGAGPALTADRILQNSDNATVAARVDAMLAEYGGEYVALWQWSDDRRHITPTIYVGDTLGELSGGRPAATFDYPGAVSSIEMPTDYSDGMGANYITAYSSGQGDLVPYSDPVIAADFHGRPVFEYRWQPVASETDPAVLGRHAAQAAPILEPGAQPLALVLAADQLEDGERYGETWQVGSHLGYYAETCPEFPDGLDGVARCIAVERDLTTITPIFAQPEVYQDADSAGGA